MTYRRVRQMTDEIGRSITTSNSSKQRLTSQDDSAVPKRSPHARHARQSATLVKPPRKSVGMSDVECVRVACGNRARACVCGVTGAPATDAVSDLNALALAAISKKRDGSVGASPKPSPRASPRPSAVSPRDAVLYVSRR
jgi:hypothetical protein